MPEQYCKRALTYEQQLSQLESRGLTVASRATALRALSSISYYRLSGYWYPFRLRNAQGQDVERLAEGTSFEQVLELYEFDRKLRSLLLDAIERVEVAVRTQITYHMGHRYGAFAHTNPSHFHPRFDHASWLAKLEQETSRSSDEFIRHYRAKYHGFPAIPIWMVTEVMSLGALSFFYKGLRNDKRAGVEDKKAVASHFGLHHKRLGDWLHTLTYVRNVCAHHSRLWNRELAIRPDKSKDALWLPPLTPRSDRIFYVVLMLRYLLRSSGNGDDWATDITRLLKPFAYNDTYRIGMGMPANWESHPLWT